MSTKVVTVGGVDVTDSIEFSDAEFISAVNGRAGTCAFRLKDTAQTEFFTSGKEITLDVDGVRSWGGYVMQIERGYFFPVDDTSTVGLVPRQWKVSGADWNILFEKRILYDKSDPTQGEIPVGGFPAGTFDSVVLQSIIANNLDLSGDGLGTSLIQHVGTPNTDSSIILAGGWSWATAMRFITSVTGAIYYISPTKDVVLTDVETADAPFSISDAPVGGDVGCRFLKIDHDGMQLVNDAMVWGAGIGSSKGVFSRAEDATSIAQHGRWQIGAPLQSIFKQTTADTVANTYVYGSPQSLRGGKDNRISIQCTVFVAGLQCGQKVVFNSNIFGDSLVIPIRMMRITFPTKTDVQWELTLSHEIDQPWTGFDAFPFPPLPPIDIGGSGTIPHFNEGFVIDDFERNTAPWRNTFYADNWLRASSGYDWSRGVGFEVVEDGVGKIQTQGSDSWYAFDKLPYLLTVTSDTVWIWSAPSLLSDSGYSTQGGPMPGIDNPGGTVYFLNINDDAVNQGFPLSLISIHLNGTTYEWDTLYRTRIQTDAASARIKTWRDADPEPNAWDVDTTGIPATITSTSVSLYFEGTNLGAEIWIANIADYSPTAGITVMPIAPTGYLCSNLRRIATPIGIDPSLTYFQTRAPYLPGSTQVWIDGLRLAWYDYDEHPGIGMIVTHTNVNTGGGDVFDPPKVAYACYVAG